jgi:hypothetical protein
MHKLERTWSLFYHRQGEQTHRRVPNGEMKTIRDFWLVYYQLLPLLQDKLVDQLHWFEHGVEPRWEDSRFAQQNIHPGILKFHFNETQFSPNGPWLMMLLMLIGENLHSPYWPGGSQSLVGMSMVLRDGFEYTLKLWTVESPWVGRTRSAPKLIQLSSIIPPIDKIYLKNSQQDILTSLGLDDDTQPSVTVSWDNMPRV